MNQPTLRKLSRYRNTRVEWTSNTCANVWLHETIIVRVDGDYARLYTGSHKTATTKRRMDEALTAFGFPHGVWQQAHEWYVGNCENRQPFFEGIRVGRTYESIERRNISATIKPDPQLPLFP